ncbi:DUF1039 domain-containing protein [Pandoraea apista]|uniref:DUF1039 domain-containing protein n=1 Tax=Pandoraea apista TaxID=93218 RepID=A0ABX9ZK13_9BURK|nr:DUF1039 domain-containing protein [Pandoraea apista]RRJ29307.1 DUF1039 domain-containing protein [Pandoraea apista]RRJ73980.1 DUF1039 domain-containing protein [Pandoraea apista]RSK76772.1 DUF1039 domain-containing protein [Pandoraea apista]
MTPVNPALGEGVGRWLDAPARQRIVELAIAGAHHGMRTEPRAILRALPSLVTDRETRQWLHVALLIALGDKGAARAHLTDTVAAGRENEAATGVLARWLDAVDARDSALASSSPSSSSSRSSSSSPSPSPSPTLLS